MSENPAETNVSRRTVLRSTGAAAAALGIGGGGLVSLSEAADDESGVFTDYVGEDEVIPNSCAPNCRGRCPIEVHVRDGRVQKTEPGIPENREYKRGCTLGLSHAQRIYNPTRLKYPMKRTGWSADDPNVDGRGEDAEFERISWDEALTIMADQMEAAKAEYGSESVYFESGSGDYGTASDHQARLASLFGGTRMDWSIDINVGQGFRRVGGAGWFNVPTNQASDLKNANTIIAWGGDIFASRLQQDSSKMLDAIENGGKLVVVDPVYTGTAAKADLWLPVKPGKDVHLALGMIHHIFENELYDAAFLRKRTLGPALVGPDGTLLKAADVLPGSDEDKPVAYNTETERVEILEPETEGAYALTGEFSVGETTGRVALDALEAEAANYVPEDIEETVGVEAGNIRKAADWLATRGPGGVVPGLGVDRYKYGHIFGQAYAVLVALTGDYGRSGSFQGGYFNGAAADFGDYSAPEGSPGYEFIRQTKILTGMESGDPFQIKVLFAQESNFIANQLPDRQRWLEAVKNLDLIAVSDMHHTPTTQHADLILPAAHWFEKVGATSPSTHPHVMYREKAHDPLWEARSDFWINSRLARKLGFGEYFHDTKPEELESMLEADEHVDYETLKSQGTVEKPVPVVKYTGEFNTDSGRLEIYDEDAPSEEGISLEVPRPVESRTAEDWEGADEYPLTFMQKHSKWRIHSQFEYQPWLRELNPEPQLDINPKDAAERGIEHGQYVRVHNERGEMVVRAKVNDAIQPGLVNTDQGWYTDDFVRGHHNDLTHTDVSPVTGNFAFYDVRVEVEPAPDDIETNMYTENPTGVPERTGDRQ
ncbi:dimethylsulfoxide reductase [Halodesulfurarchaeum formicicum]|uniref:Dimethylsulfoxide reductase n=1 Tax=Halodesulfurarchaeum formicicum TaxID=1873524 RepID=A0A1D8S2Z5_9EURY|nr:molybdopterin-dependent oxidoreductase [Halodesulfurarchaeum formicicum]AOW79713.1 dimethylsulfoxide reductase [Halodesulfurarchaeum formicicum]